VDVARATLAPAATIAMNTAIITTAAAQHATAKTQTLLLHDRLR